VVAAVDLYAGAGGLSVGLSAAGARVVLAVEADDHAAATYRMNHPDTVVLQRRVTAASRLTKALAARPDLLAGGPPCQGWSTLGHRASLPRQQRHNAGVADFLRQVRLLEPNAVLFENVRGFAVADGGRRLQELRDRLEHLGYSVGSRLYRASDHGVPQLRHRLFVVAIRRGLAIEGSTLLPDPSREEVPTLADAIDDLPRLDAGESARAYDRPPGTPLQRRLRGSAIELTWHEAPAHAPHILRLIAALPPEGGSRADLDPLIAPHSGFHNTYGRLRSDRPAPAVTGAIGRVSSGRHVHPTQARALSPREAARLQTFPDTYGVVGGRYAAYQQIGNAVPPDLASAVAGPVVAALLGSGAAVHPATLAA
jgi:DNA (cytosine-5)-methyltransferase 1